MHTPMLNADPHLAVHPLYRIAMESPEQLEPALRRAVFRMVRRRLAAWFRATLTAAMSNFEGAQRKQRTSWRG